MSQLGQNQKSSMRAYVFRFTVESRHPNYDPSTSIGDDCPHGVVELCFCCAHCTRALSVDLVLSTGTVNESQTPLASMRAINHSVPSASATASGPADRCQSKRSRASL
jgi:hypothetical protein